MMVRMRLHPNTNAECRDRHDTGFRIHDEAASCPQLFHRCEDPIDGPAIREACQQTCGLCSCTWEDSPSYRTFALGLSCEDYFGLDCEDSNIFSPPEIAELKKECPVACGITQSCPPTVHDCEDNLKFRDSKFNLTCNEWAGSNCERQGDEQLSSIQKFLLHQNCPVACRSCYGSSPILSIFSC